MSVGGGHGTRIGQELEGKIAASFKVHGRVDSVSKTDSIASMV